MMRTSELKAFAEKHGIPTMTIKELQEYRKVKEAARFSREAGVRRCRQNTDYLLRIVM